MDNLEQRKWVRQWWLTKLRDLADNAPDLEKEITMEIWQDESLKIAARLSRSCKI